MFESTPVLKEKIQTMCNKIQNKVSRLCGINIANPNLVEVYDVTGFNWNIQGAEFVFVVLNSNACRDLITRKYEFIKQQCKKAGSVPNQVILSRTFEQSDFHKRVVPNLM